MLTPVRVPSPAEEAVRDMVRARGDLLDDRKRVQQRLSALLLRHGCAWGGKVILEPRYMWGQLGPLPV
jgi:transposase